MSQEWPRIERFDIEGLVRLTPRVFPDARGAFCETYSRQAYANAIGDVNFFQDNVSHSIKRGTVRGLHFQASPMAQAKLVRVLKGAILDVVVDVRRGSPTYGRHVAVELSAANGAQLFVPRGFLHGFCTTEDDTHVFYKVDAPYSPAHDGAVFWADPELGIEWPVSADEAVLSEKDLKARTLREVAAALGEF